MSDTLWNVPFPVQNSQRKYPLAADATGVDTSGDFTLPDDFIVGLNIPVQANDNLDLSKFFIQSIGSYDTGFAVVVAYSGVTDVQVATAWIPRSGHTRNASYRLAGVGDFDDTLGTIVIGRFDDIDKQPVGSFTFSLAGSRISTDSIRPTLRAVQSIAVSDGSSLSDRYTGDIELIPHKNMQITVTETSGQPTVIRFSAIDGEGFAEPCQCAGDAVPPCIRRINGIPGTSDGDYLMTGNECFNIVAIQHGLRFEDTCSSPCCGCDELEDVTRNLQILGGKVVSLESFTAKMDNSVSQFSNVILASKLSDQGCDTCGDGGE